MTWHLGWVSWSRRFLQVEKEKDILVVHRHRGVEERCMAGRMHWQRPLGHRVQKSTNVRAGPGAWQIGPQLVLTASLQESRKQSQESMLFLAFLFQSQPRRSSDLSFLEFFNAFLALSLVHSLLLTYPWRWVPPSLIFGFLPLKHPWGRRRVETSCEVQVWPAAEEADKSGGESLWGVLGEFCRQAWWQLGPWWTNHNLQLQTTPFESLWGCLPKVGSLPYNQPKLVNHQIGIFKSTQSALLH